MKKLISVLLLTAVLLTACGGDAEGPIDPRQGLVEYYCDGLYFYLDQELKQTQVQDAGMSFVSDAVELHVESLWLEEFDDGIKSSEDFAAAYADLVEDEVESVSVYQANGVWYDVIGMGGHHLVCGFYVQGEYGWMIGAVTEEFQTMKETLIRYVTLGRIKDGFDPGPKPEQGITSSHKPGDTVTDLAVTDADGRRYEIAQLLQEKELVVLNFWFADCGWCVKEFPVMEVAYQRYKDSVEILALNPVDETSRITAFQGEHGLTFPMMSCTRDTSLGFGVNAYPTSVFIDRTGTICLIQSGAITDTTVFYNIFDHFTGDDYQQKIFKDLSELN